MNKQTFLSELDRRLSCLPKAEKEERLAFYREMIDDRMEDGIGEEAATAELGEPSALAAQIIAETPLTKLVKEKIAPQKKIKAWEIMLIVLGAPLWLPVLISGLATLACIYLSVWVVIIAMWAVFASLVISGLAGVFAGIFFAVRNDALIGMATIGASLVCTGLGVFAYFVCKGATKGVLYCAKKCVLKIKNSFIKKEESK